MLQKISQCRICKNQELTEVIDLGLQALSGWFPAPGETVSQAPLKLIKCDERVADSCGLLQLAHTYDLNTMYGDNYGYRSGLNQSMVQHLRERLQWLQKYRLLNAGDVVIDIGSNDGTLLKSYTTTGLERIGVDPTIRKFASYYPDDIIKVADFFSASVLSPILKLKKAQVITSMAMFYDLEDPLQFVKEVASLLDRDGLWMFEQSYMPTMLALNSYDTICHEHLEYYGMKQIQWLLGKADLKIVDVELTSANGGSFCILAGHQAGPYQSSDSAAQLLRKEEISGLSSLQPYKEFAERVYRHAELLPQKIRELQQDGRQVLGYGASTKGNVILQHCHITTQELPFILEVNEDKFGKTTPGTCIPIRSEKTYQLQKHDVLLPLPWHFRNFFEKTLQEFLQQGGAILYPLPEIELFTMDSKG